MAYIKAPNMSIWEYDDNNNPTGEYFTPIYSYQGDGVSYYNPIAVANLGRNDTYNDGLDNTFTLRYRVNEWLTLRETVSFQFGGTKAKTFLPYNAIGSDWLGGQVNSARETNNMSQSIRNEMQVAVGDFIKNQNHELSGAFTFLAERYSGEYLGVMSARSPSTDVQDPSADPLVWAMWNGTYESRLLRSVNNINYKFLDRYLLQGILTLDGHSSFGENNRWGLFQGVFVGWRFSNEPFLRSLSWLSESMIRASWGVSGRQPDDVYARFASYESSGTGNYILEPAIAPTKIELTNLKWENIASWDVGIELGLFSDRAYLEANIYEKTTNDILFDRYNIPSSTGYDELRFFNGGMLTNRGWELMADFKLVRNANWLWAVNFNASQNINAFDALPDNFNNEQSTSIGNGQYPLMVEEGEPIGSFFGFRYKGVWPSDEDVVARDANGNISRDSEGNPIPLRYSDTYTFQGGDPIYEDINHDGKIDLNDVVYIGDSNPNFLGGFGTVLQYKNWDLSVAFHYRTGFDIINGIAIQTQGMNNRNNQSKATLRRWRIQGQDEEGMLPRAYMNHPANNLGSDRYVEKGDYLRLNNLKLSYRLNSNLLNRLRLRKAILSLSARKLYTFTQYTGQDPAIGQDASNPFWIGVDYARTPPPKIFTMSIAIGF
jgi:TonB-linked SusC/RagA family outer membrane protein